MIVQERLDRVTIRELIRLAEKREERSRKEGRKDESARWYETAEWLRDLNTIAR